MAATFGFASPAAANSLPSGIASVVTDLIGSKSDTLTDLSDTKFTQTHSFLKDQYGRERVHALVAEASWKWHLMDVTYIKLLSTFCGGYHNTMLNLINGDKVVFGDTNYGHNGTIKCRLVIGGGTSADRYVEMSVKRHGVVGSTVETVYDNDLLWGSLTSAASGALFTGGLGYRSPGGIVKFEVRGVDTYEELGDIQDASFNATFQCDEDSQGRYIPRNTVAIDYSVDVKNLHPTGSVNLLDTFHQYPLPYTRFTLIDGVVITCADKLGAVIDPTLDGDVDKAGILRIHGSGEILLSAWSGMFP
jgi:hypothetical protein